MDKSRKVFPQKDSQGEGKAGSRVTAQEAEFKQFIGDSSQGILARFFYRTSSSFSVWSRSPRNSQIVFGAQLKLAALQADLRPLIQPERPLRPEICVALLDDNGKPIARSHPEFTADWKHPFVWRRTLARSYLIGRWQRMSSIPPR